MARNVRANILSKRWPPRQRAEMAKAVLVAMNAVEIKAQIAFMVFVSRGEAIGLLENDRPAIREYDVIFIIKFPNPIRAKG